MTSAGQLLEGFTDWAVFDLDSVASAPTGSGVHLVADDTGAVVYVGATGSLRDRLRQHLQGDRQASVLREQVGELLDTEGDLASPEDITGWLGRCTVRWRLAEDPRGVKAELVQVLSPRFNRVTESARTGVWWVCQGRSYDDEHQAGVVFAGSGGPQVAHHLNVSRMRRGDVVLHYRKGWLVALGEVVAAPVQAQRPYNAAAVRDEGWLTRVEYFPLESPIPLAELPPRDGGEGPFGKAGTVKQGYLFPVDLGYAGEVRASFAVRWPPGSPWSGGSRGFWLFQANPKQWDLVAHLPQMPPGHLRDWTVTRRADMHPGDAVVLWQGGDSAGV